jgi:hypothetical protein
MLVVNGEETVFVVMPARVDDHEASVAEGLLDQSFNHAGQEPVYLSGAPSRRPAGTLEL